MNGIASGSGKPGDVWLISLAMKHWSGLCGCCAPLSCREAVAGHGELPRVLLYFFDKPVMLGRLMRIGYFLLLSVFTGDRFILFLL